MALMSPTRPEDQLQMTMGTQPAQLGMVQHPMHAMIAPLGAPPPDLQPMGMSPEGAPSTSGMSPQPKARQASPLERYEDKQGQRLMSDIDKDENPYGSPNNHPGVLGKILHGLSVATGGPNRRLMEEAGLSKGLNEMENETSKRGLEGAQTENQTATAAHTNAETPEVGPNAESERALQGAQTNKLENPSEEWSVMPGVIGPNGEPVEYEKTSGQMRFGSVSGLQQQKQPKPDSPEQQYIDEYMKAHKGGTVAQAERAYSLDTQKPPQAIMLMHGHEAGAEPGLNAVNTRYQHQVGSVFDAAVD